MVERVQAEISRNQTSIPVQQEEIRIVSSGLPDQVIEEIYEKLKNEGKCCEGGSEGWMG